IGIAQAIAIVPGISRSGITTVMGKSRGLSREDSLKFSFLLSIPIIFSVLAGSIGGTFGSSISYGIGKGIIAPLRMLKNNNSKNSKKRSRTGEFINKYGEFSVFIAQLIGQTRTFISYPAGVLKFNFKKFVLYTFLGSAIWCALTLGLITFINGLWHKYKPLVEIHSGLAIIILFTIIIFISQIWIYIISRRTKKDSKNP
ncbi:unnamed protein product, partial [marine sediment metagenome]